MPDLRRGQLRTIRTRHSVIRFVFTNGTLTALFHHTNNDTLFQSGRCVVYMPTVYITAPRDVAKSLANELVEERLAACVNRLPCQSTYWWDGEIQNDEEVILLAKTSAIQYPKLVDYVKEVHPYETPCIERFDETALLDSFREWVREETAS